MILIRMSLSARIETSGTDRQLRREALLRGALLLTRRNSAMQIVCCCVAAGKTLAEKQLFANIAISALAFLNKCI